MIRYMVALKAVPYYSAGWPIVLRLPEGSAVCAECGGDAQSGTPPLCRSCAAVWYPTPDEIDCRSLPA